MAFPISPMVGFDVPPYLPPRRLRGGHRQTIWPSLFRTVDGVAYQRERLELADGDFIDLDWMRGEDPDAPVAIVAHGLEGSSERAYVRGMVRALHRRGWDVLAWNLRGCSGEPNRLPRAYHSGDSDEIDWILRRMRARFPQRTLYAAGEPNRLLRTYHSGVSDDLDAIVQHVLSGSGRQLAVLGFSLGGNVTLKWLGEQGEGKDPRIVAGVGISVPVDLAGSARVMEGLSRRL